VGYHGREERRKVAALIVVSRGILELESYPTTAFLENGVLTISYTTPAPA
jgi:hypothetical protein